VGYLRQEAIYTSGDNALDRFNLRSNIDVKISKNLSAAIDISGKIQNLSDPVAGTNEVFTNIFNALTLYPTSLPDPSLIPYSGKGPQNPVAITTRDISGYNDRNNNKYQATMRLNYKVPFIKGLKASGRFDYLGNMRISKLWEKDYDLYTYDTDSDSYALAASQDKVSLREDMDRSRILTGQFSLDYERIFLQDHRVKGLLVYEVIDSKGNDFWAMRQEFLTSAIDQLYASGIEFQDLSGRAYEDGRISYIGRINYSFRGKYLAEGSFRYDGSNRFNPENRWGLFPSVSVAWRLSEEDFIQFSWLNNLKVRASYSQSGRDNTGKFQFLTGYELGADYIMNDRLVQGIRSTGLPNPDITWENMTTYNTGFDLGILQHKLSAEFDIFYRLREGILESRDRSLPNTVGANLPEENLNSLSNRGFEFTLGHRNQVGDLKYSLRGMVSWARARWEYFDEPAYTEEDDIRIRQNSGNWTNRTFGYQWEGFFQSQEEIDAWPVDQDRNGNTTLAPGDLKYLDLNGDSTLNWRDQVLIGKTGTPEWMVGLNMDLSYKGFALSMLWQGALGHYVEMDTRNVFSSSFPKPFSYMYDYRWKEGVEDALYPRASLATVDNNTENSDFWLKPASYLRLKSLSLKYSLPSAWIQGAGISDIGISIGGYNLLTFSGLNEYGFDPESPKNQTGKYYPQMRTLFVGLNINF
jgi:TonB-linked SusC/RagA family outer membrane protein